MLLLTMLVFDRAPDTTDLLSLGFLSPGKLPDFRAMLCKMIVCQGKLPLLECIIAEVAFDAIDSAGKEPLSDLKPFNR